MKFEKDMKEWNMFGELYALLKKCTMEHMSQKKLWALCVEFGQNTVKKEILILYRISWHVICIRTAYLTTGPVRLLSKMIRKRRKCSRHFISYAKNIGLGRRKQKMLIGMAV